MLCTVSELGGGWVGKAVTRLSTLVALPGSGVRGGGESSAEHSPHVAAGQSLPLGLLLATTASSARDCLQSTYLSGYRVSSYPTQPSPCSVLDLYNVIFFADRVVGDFYVQRHIIKLGEKAAHLVGEEEKKYH